MARRRSLALRRLGFPPGKLRKTRRKGQIDDWAASEPQLAATMNWSKQPSPFADQFSQIWSLGYAHGTLYAGTKPARLLSKSGRRQKLGRSSRSARSPFCRQLEIPVELDWYCTPFCLIQRTPKSCGSGFLRLVSLRPRMVAGLGIVVTGYQIRGLSAERSHPAGPRDGEIGHCVHNLMRAPGRTDLLYERKTIMASGVLPMAVGVGTTSRAVFRQRLGFRSAFIHGTRNHLDRALER